LLENYLSETQIGINEFKENRNECLQKWEKFYPHGLPQAIVCDYYNAVDYSFGPEHKRSLKKFYELCGLSVDLNILETMSNR